jgi:hypothetical protein
MKTIIKTALALSTISFQLNAQHKTGSETQKVNAANTKETKKNLYLDVHHLEAGKTKFKDVAGAHAKDLMAQGKYGVKFLKFWVNEEKGLVYCLASAPSPDSLTMTHSTAHGLIPDHIYLVTEGQEAKLIDQKHFFLDVHEFGAGKVNAKAVAGAHEKDLQAQKKHGVNFVNYWVCEEDGVVMCLSQAKDANAVTETHKEAHGLMPAYVLEVKQGE